MERQTVGREDLYDFKASPGEHIPAIRDPILLWLWRAEEKEAEEAVIEGLEGAGGT